ncbi:MAG: alpha/beta fold hydrolase [Rhodoferax sp.]|uniref:alpha/beta fold hydrolase n=1 Tax=Rhodoferax sp. TaxID=50421 RepID=UPI002734CB60|nr:alpha/beta fold hydrolase [Rhodoferax sp.]MDP2679043.1 alpha/beta fold hydrolase [Rhodoferax sp.]
MLVDKEAKALIARLTSLARREFVEHDGRRVCWRGFGAGSPVVLLHGGHGSWLHWLRNIEALAAHHAVWVPDLPGYGDSDHPVPNDGLPSLLEPMIATLNRLVGTDTPIDLVGFSFGGLVAAHVAARRPQVRRLALLGPVGHQGRRRPRGELRSWKVAVQSANASTLDEIMRHNLAMHMLHMAAQDIDPLAVQIHTEACLRTRFRSKEISRGGGLMAALAQRRGPSLLAWGEHDVTAEPEIIARALSDRLPGCHTHFIEGAGHWVQFERADDINRLLLAWLSADSKDMT